MQSKLHSLFEILLNVFTGFIIAVITQYFVYPMYGIETTVFENMQLAGIFIAASIIRGYIWRRFWNSKLNRKEKTIRGDKNDD